MASFALGPAMAVSQSPSARLSSSSARLACSWTCRLPPGRRHGEISSSFPRIFFSFPLRRRRQRRLVSSSAADSSSSDGHSDQKNVAFREWDATTARFAGAANVPFLLLQLPQILLNYRNLAAGNNAALFALPWLGILTGLLGNLSLLSYFAKKREAEAVVVQTLGVLSNYAVIAQLAIAGSMPLPQFALTSAVVGAGLVLNFLNYFNWLGGGAWTVWEDFITIGGLAVLPQVMWSTFVPFVPNSILPGLLSSFGAVVAVVMARTGKLSEKWTKIVGLLSGWTATLLFMWMPVAQMWTNYLNPDNIQGLSAITMLLSMIGNGLMIPRALFIRDLMWFTGSSWASFLHGWGNLLCMYKFNSISKEFFFAASLGLLLWLGTALWRDTIAYGHPSPFKSLKELFFEK
ncbi:maltose excess protein 1-like, chloroplastic [Wolffia australiana]